MTNERRIERSRRPSGRIRPTFDRLESRRALSGLGLGTLPPSTAPAPPSTQATVPRVTAISVAAVDPAPGATLNAPPAVIAVTFDRPIDSFTVGLADFRLVHVADDGSTTPLSVSEAYLNEALDPADPSSARVDLTLSGPLAAGRYRLTLLGSNQIQGLDGSAPAGAGKDLVLSTFSIVVPGVGLGDAVPLGTTTSTVATRSDVLDLAKNPYSVDLYKIDLPAGHFWRLGLEVTSSAIDGRFDAAISLFDSQGHLIATNSPGQSGKPGDAYLFAGVVPGTYYVGVSAQRNVPGTPNGYDPSTSKSGVAAPAAQGGPFLLSSVADPADQPAQVLGLRLDRADPNSTEPTGLTIQFSGTIRAQGLQFTDHPGLTLVDASGRSWGVTPIGYDPSQALLSVVFDQALPPGFYTLRADGLVDLAGLTPSAPGDPPGVLGTFSVATAARTPDDLGPILPGLARSGLAATVEVAPGSTATRQFAVVMPGFYTLSTSPCHQCSLVDRAGNSLLSMSMSMSMATGSQHVLLLTAGTYTMTFANATSEIVSNVLTIREVAAMADSLLMGGAAQGPAINLRLISPIAGLVGSDESPPVDRTANGVDPQPARAGSASSGASSTASTGEPGARAVPSGPSTSSGSFLLIGIGPVGRPSASTGPIRVSSGSSGLGALASTQQGLPFGLAPIPKETTRKRLPEPAAPLIGLVPDESGRRPGSPVLDAHFGLLAHSEAPPSYDRLLAEAARVEHVASLILGRLGSLAAPIAPPAPGSTDPPASTTAEAEALRASEPRIELASTASPVGIGVLAVIAYRCRERILRRLRKVDDRPRVGTHRPLLSGPHRASRVFR